jgi:hypothetical protein
LAVFTCWNIPWNISWIGRIKTTTFPVGICHQLPSIFQKVFKGYFIGGNEQNILHFPTRFIPRLFEIIQPGLSQVFLIIPIGFWKI